MLELKFRAWNTEDNLCFIIPNDSFSLSIHDTGNTVLMWADCEVIDEIPMDIVERYTGLKDRNGTDIYDGDIVDFYQDGEFHKTQEIKADDTGCFWVGVDGFDYDYEPISSAVNNHHFELVIVGNIHENPELLEQ